MLFLPSRLKPIALACVALLLIVDCQDQSGSGRGSDLGSASARQAARGGARATDSREVIDDFGRVVRVGASSPRRVVSLNPTTTEIIYAIGEQARLVGRSHWDRWPREAIAKPDLGDGIRPNVELLIAARPDLVVLYATETNREAAARLAAAGIATLALRINTIAQFDSATRLIGRVLGNAAAGVVVADSVMRSLAQVRRATDSLPHPSVVWRLAAQPPMVVGGGSFMSELLDVAGARNLYSSLPQPSPVVAIEDVISRNPDVLIVGGDIGDTAVSQGPWRAVSAVRAHHVVSVPTDLVARPSVQMGSAAVTLARALHPGAVFR